MTSTSHPAYFLIIVTIYGLKFFKDIPLYFPWWTSLWHLLHRGICFLFIAAIILSKGDSFVPIVRICLRWCASTLSKEPQLAQACSRRFRVLIFHFGLIPGSSCRFVTRNFLGVCINGGHLKSMVTCSLPLLYVYLICLP